MGGAIPEPCGRGLTGMDAFHDRLARLALQAGGEHGFCLAGGYAVQAYGFVERVSMDVDLFTTQAAVADFATAQAEVVEALREDGLVVTVERQGPTFARLAVGDPVGGHASTVELAVDWRAFPPVQMDIGPVLHPDDAVANKLCALFGRAEVRDYVDMHGVLRDGRYSTAKLLRLGAEHDLGFDTAMFAEALRAVRRFPASAFEPYGLDTEQIDALVQRLVAWADEIAPGAA